MDIKEIHIKGIREVEKRNYKEAIVLFTKILKKMEVPEVYYNRGSAYLKMENYTMAMADMNKAIKLSPENADFIGQRAVIFHLSGKNKEAMADFNKAVAMEPENDYRYAARAYVKDKTGDNKGAVEDYKKALELDPENAVTLNNLGLAEQKLGYMEHSKKHFDSADKFAKKYFGDDMVDDISNKEQISEGDKNAVDKNSGYGENFSDQEIASTKPQEKNKSLTIGHILKTTKNIFTSKKGMKEFLSFTKESVFGKKKPD